MITLPRPAAARAGALLALLLACTGNNGQGNNDHPGNNEQAGTGASGTGGVAGLNGGSAGSAVDTGGSGGLGGVGGAGSGIGGANNGGMAGSPGPIPGSAGMAPVVSCSNSCAEQSGWVCSSASPARCTYPSCSGMNGTECNDGGDCCQSPLVKGGTFTQGPDSADGSTFQSTVADFRLDRYEVTVARFRAFVNAYDDWHGAKAKPAVGDGANPNVSGSGWTVDYSSSLSSTSSGLKSKLGCALQPTWADPGNDTLPINCVDWYGALAFCIWDGGRLPTEAEWEYAAGGGSTHSLYPWGNTPALTNMQDSTAAYANYFCLGDGSQPDSCAFSDMLAVGSKPLGRGAYGQDDLAGSMDEWTLDWYAPYPSTASTNYADLTKASLRVLRSGDWLYNATFLATTSREYYDPTLRSNYVGFRCAREP